MSRRGLMLAFVIALTLMIASAEIIIAVKMAPRQCEMPREATWAKPDLRACPANMSLWECIEGAHFSGSRDDI